MPALAGCSGPAPETRSASLFASRVTLTCYGRPSGPVADEVFARLGDIDRKLNMWDADSELSRLNAGSGSGPIAASADLVAVAARALDFGALAKGYGATEAARILRERGLRSAILDVGGCVVALGSAPGGKAWRIGVQDPGSARGHPLGYLRLRDSAVATSGTYLRYFEEGGRRYAHIMDTRTGRPVESALVSATVALPVGENPDGPPLALLALGPEAGLALADRLGLVAVLVGEDRRVYLSREARGIFTLSDTSFRLAPQ